MIAPGYITRTRMDELAMRRHGRVVPPPTLSMWLRQDDVAPIRQRGEPANLYPEAWWLDRLERWAPGRNITHARAMQAARRAVGTVASFIVAAIALGAAKQ